MSDATSEKKISQIKHHEIWKTIINGDEMFFIISGDYVQEGYESPKWLNIGASDTFVFDIEDALKLIDEEKAS